MTGDESLVKFPRTVRFSGRRIVEEGEDLGVGVVVGGIVGGFPIPTKERMWQFEGQREKTRGGDDIGGQRWRAGWLAAKRVAVLVVR